MPHPGDFVQALAAAIVDQLLVRDKLAVGPNSPAPGRRAEFNGPGDTRIVVRDTNAAKAWNFAASHGSVGAGNLGIGLEGVAVYISINGTTGRVGLQNQTVGTGAATPTLSANKPGANAGVATWLTINVNGTDYYLPLWS